MTCRLKLKRLPICAMSAAMWQQQERSITMNKPAGTPDRQQKHHEILDSYELLFRSIDSLEDLVKRVLHGDAPEVAKTAPEDLGSVTLGQFLEAFPLQVRELTNRIDVARSDLTQALF